MKYSNKTTKYQVRLQEVRTIQNQENYKTS
jgi:hypothetical protein